MKRNLASVVPIPSDHVDAPAPLSTKDAFKQQRLRAWQPILTPHWVIFTFFLFGLIFLGLGVILVHFAGLVVEHKIEYAKANRDNKFGEVIFEVTEEMKQPVYVYYELNDFYQNHRRYEKSRDDQQLRDPSPQGSTSGGTCNPHETNMETGKKLYPCGLVADTHFDDVFYLQGRPSGSTGDWSDAEEYVLDQTPSRIAWSTDVELRFKNLEPTIENQKNLDMWILADYPPTVCRPKFSSTVWNNAEDMPIPYVKKETPLVKCNFTGVDGATTDSCEFESCIPTEDSVGCEPLECIADNGFEEVPNPSNWGVENGHFIVWMRIAALPHFRKNYGIIDQDIPAGTTMRLVFEDHFAAETFDGKKHFVMSTRTWAGGKNHFLGFGYIIIGATCLLFGIFFLVRQCRTPRILGDVTRLDWMEFSGPSMN